jgi:pSer/pThr/pTyr-binding forkhead associated (FHA) protein
MARLILQFEDDVLKEYVIGLLVTIGRLPENTVVIDNPAVSGHHACVFRDGDRYVIEDLRSTNGTFVNQTRVTRHALEQDDVVLVGKHKLVFDQLAAADGVVPLEAELTSLTQGDTVLLDTRQHRALLAKLMDAAAQASAATGAAPTPAPVPARVGVLRVLAGRSDQSEYDLEGHTSIIGTAEQSLVRLRGWFKPDVAVAITRNRQGYVATLLGGKTRINSQPLTGRHELKEGDVLRVSGLTLEFGLKVLAVDPPTSLPV